MKIENGLPFEACRENPVPNATSERRAASARRWLAVPFSLRWSAAGRNGR